MRWNPAVGHIPRGFCGGVGQLAKIELVLIVAEPGDPYPGEAYNGESAKELLDASCRHTYKCFESGTDLFHRNLRRILDLCWPQVTFAEQMRRTWITESTLCSADRECGPVQRAVTHCCVDRYLAKQLSLMPDAAIVTLGGKAKSRISNLGTAFLRASAAAPPGCNFADAIPSWNRVAVEVRRRAELRP